MEKEKLKKLPDLEINREKEKAKISAMAGNDPSKIKVILGPRERPKSIGQWITLSLQHVFAMFGANVLVPIIINTLYQNHGGSGEVINASMALFASGLGTLIYIALTAAKVPIYLGSSFAYMTVIGVGYADWGNAVFIAIFLVGCVYTITGLIIHFTGNKWLLKAFSPIVVGPIIMTIGLGAIPSALENCQIIPTTLDAGTNYPRWLAILLALMTFMIAAVFMLKAKGFSKVLPILIALVFGYIISVIIQVSSHDIKLMNFEIMTDVKKWEWYPNFKNIFNVDRKTIAPAIVAIVPIALVTMVEHYGDHVNLSNMTGKNFIEDPGIDRTLMADGVSIMVVGLIGGPTNTTYAENTSVVGITKIASVWVTGLAAIIAIMMSFLAPINQAISMSPKPVLGGISLLLFGIIATNGVRVMIDGKVDLSDAKNLIVIAITIGTGVGLTMADTISGTTSLTIGNFQISGLLLATVLGVALNLILPNQINDGLFKIKFIEKIKEKHKNRQ